jgi:glycogen(starch) synthase
MVAHAAVSMRQDANAPLVTTLHATEAGRNRGWITTGLSTTIHSLEWWLANSSDRVITCSQHMDSEVRSLFGIGPTTVIANGIDIAAWHAPAQAVDRIRAANADAGRLIAYTGRVEWEKGVQTLVDAMPHLLPGHPGLRLLVAGRGTYLPTLQAQAGALGLGDAVRFLGWVSEEDLRAVVAASEVAVAPSLYEPFGLTALEAAALGTPLVVSATGGLAEFAHEGQLAATFRPGDAEGLARAVGHDLDHPAGARARAARACDALAVDYEWHHLADLTVAAYAEARREITAPATALQAQSRRTVERPRLRAPLGRLLDVGW